MSTRGIYGFRINETNKLAYNHSDSFPDTLGATILNQLGEVQDWDRTRNLVGNLVSLDEIRELTQHDGIFRTELRGHYPDLKYDREPQDFCDLISPLQGTIEPYLSGRLFYERGYVANLDKDNVPLVLQKAKGLRGITDPNTKKLRTCRKFAAHSRWSGRRDWPSTDGSSGLALRAPQLRRTSRLRQTPLRGFSSLSTKKPPLARRFYFGRTWGLKYDPNVPNGRSSENLKIETKQLNKSILQKPHSMFTQTALFTLT
ncbi:MAG: hypothetical protein ACPGGN_02820 [Opitutales bacterium]